MIHLGRALTDPDMRPPVMALYVLQFESRRRLP